MVLRNILQEGQTVFAYEAVTLYGDPFQGLHLTDGLITSRRFGRTVKTRPMTPNPQRLPPYARIWFRLFPVRSPLLRESRLISVPPVTEMFQFTGFAFSAYVFS